MNTATVAESARRYLDAVRDGLFDILPSEDAEEVLQDLEAHLAEIDPDEIQSTLGAPEDFIAEFRASAGLDEPSARGGGLARLRSKLGQALIRATEQARGIAAPLVTPLSRHRDEIRTAWIWSRGVLAVAAYSWAINGDLYGNRQFLAPRNGGLMAQVAVLALATLVSVKVGATSGRWWRRASIVASLGVGYLLLLAISTNHYIAYPEEQAFEYYGDGFGEYAESAGPVMLIGPDGPVQNIYAYDLDGNPIEALLYDEQGNPLLTLPGYAYDQATNMPGYEPFIWEGFEIVFRKDKYGRPIGNLFPLERYDWTETGARSAPQPPPVVGIPEVPEPQPEATDDGDVAVTSSPASVTSSPASVTSSPASVTSSPASVTSTSLPETSTESDPTAQTTEPPRTTTTLAE